MRGGSISDAGGAGNAGHWRCCGTAGTAWGVGVELLAQALSASASIGNASLVITFNPFGGGLLVGLDADLVGSVGAAGLLGSRLVVDERLLERELGAKVELGLCVELMLDALDLERLESEQHRQRHGNEAQPREEGLDQLKQWPARRGRSP